MMSELFRPLCDGALVGMVHLLPLPGSPFSKQTLREIRKHAEADARVLLEAGFDGVLIENFGDAPFRGGQVDFHTVSAMTLIARAVRGVVDCPLGINVLRNDPQAALAVAGACGASFVRINVHTGVYATDQGIIQGRADETLRYRRRLGVDVALYADVHVKHARPLSSSDIVEAAEEAAWRGRADGLIVSGSATGKPTSFEDLRRVRAAVSDRPVFVGSGATAETIRAIIDAGCGAIVGTSIKQDGRTTGPVDRARAEVLVAAARG